MVKYAISNIALSAFTHDVELNQLREMGFRGLEIAPSRVWHDTWKGLSAAEVSVYRTTVERAGLQAVGLHSLFYDHPDLGLFKNAEGRQHSLDFLVHLSAVCRDLGGKTLVWGGGRRRGATPIEEATREAINFMSDLCRRVEGHGTCFCFEPLGPNDSDFINSAYDALKIVKEIDHASLRVQLDAKALVENDEVELETFQNVEKYLVHFHVNEPGLNVLGSSGEIDHAALSSHLKAIKYNGYLSLEQRQVDPKATIENIRQSAGELKKSYG